MTGAVPQASYTRHFSREPASVSAARHFATQVLTDMTSDVLDAVELMVSELASNCVRHSGTAFELAITSTGADIRVEVTDPGSGTPHVRHPRPDEPTGRGLQIVDMLSKQWGVKPQPPNGKTVWFTVAGP